MKTPKAKPASEPADPKNPSGLPITVEIGTITLDDGYARFLDRTVDPAFAQEISRLGLVIEGLSSVPGRRARVATQAVIGGSSAFDLKGEIAPIGEVYADLVKGCAAHGEADWDNSAVIQELRRRRAQPGVSPSGHRAAP